MSHTLTIQAVFSVSSLLFTFDYFHEHVEMSIQGSTQQQHTKMSVETVREREIDRERSG